MNTNTIDTKIFAASTWAYVWTATTRLVFWWLIIALIDRYILTPHVDVWIWLILKEIK